ncbi:hypothetical protein P7K49_028501 [Saguinus oedipus]|uniref:Uncharacterized protein n=1 Tax=Saguinus oedipus TaxID=9490 RepID=A0ABQ9U5P5_SAGOE|nr:hypothetical protein P7K49_028501 [Saguinus oedipus]
MHQVPSSSSPPTGPAGEGECHWARSSSTPNHYTEVPRCLAAKAPLSPASWGHPCLADTLSDQLHRGIASLSHRQPGQLMRKMLGEEQNAEAQVIHPDLLARVLLLQTFAGWGVAPYGCGGTVCATRAAKVHHSHNFLLPLALLSGFVYLTCLNLAFLRDLCQ